MSSERFTLRAAVYLFLINGTKMLLSRRYKTGWMDGSYSLVAGHLDGNESVSKSMLREAKEEAGIIILPKDLKAATVLHRFSTDQEYMDFFFIARKWKGTPKIMEPDKCDDLSWFPMSKLPEKTLPYIKTALQNFKNGIAFAESGWQS